MWKKSGEGASSSKNECATEGSLDELYVWIKKDGKLVKTSNLIWYIFHYLSC
jgi:hypothetical protein